MFAKFTYALKVLGLVLLILVAVNLVTFGLTLSVMHAVSLAVCGLFAAMIYTSVLLND